MLDAQADDAQADDAQASDAARLMVCGVPPLHSGERDRRTEWAGSGKVSRCQTFCLFSVFVSCDLYFFLLETAQGVKLDLFSLDLSLRMTQFGGWGGSRVIFIIRPSQTDSTEQN